MALDPHPDREPGMDARVVNEATDEVWAKSHSDGLWHTLGHCCYGGSLTWPQLAKRLPDATVVLP